MKIKYYFRNAGIIATYKLVNKLSLKHILNRGYEFKAPLKANSLKLIYEN